MSRLRSTAFKLSDTVYEDVSGRVQLLKTCTFYHKTYGKVEITRKMLSEIVANFNDKSRGIEVMIDYGHESDKKAAGWIKNLELIRDPGLNQDQLWANVEWTPNGRRVLSDKEYAYLSADFDPLYEDNENPNKHFGAVLLGAGLTNRPVVKRMESAIQLSEHNPDDVTENTQSGSLFKQENNMPLEEEKKIEEEKKLEEMKPGEELKPEEKKLEEDIKSEDDVMAKLNSFMEELGISSVEDLMKLVSSLRESNVEGEKQLAEMKKTKVEGEKKVTFDKLMTEGFVIEAQREDVLKLAETEFNSFIKIAKLAQPIKLAEVGHGKDEVIDETKGKTNDEIISEKAIKLAEEKGIDFAKACTIVMNENKELAKKRNDNENI